MITRKRAFAYSLLALGVGVLAYLLGVGNSLGQRAEESLLDASVYSTNPPAPLGLLSPMAIVVAFAVLALVAIFAHGFLRAIVIAVYGSVAILASQLLKYTWLDRPNFLDQDATNTFPSGHMTAFAALVAAMIWAVPRGARAVTGVIGAALLGAVSWQLLEYGWHRPSDLLGAQALVVLVYGVGSWLGPRSSRRDAATQLTPGGLANKILRIVVLVSGIALTLGGLVLIAAAGSVASSELMMSAGKLTLIGVSAVCSYLLQKLSP